jgi:hypothetical protein
LHVKVNFPFVYIDNSENTFTFLTYILTICAELRLYTRIYYNFSPNLNFLREES